MKLAENNNEVKYPYSQYPYVVNFRTNTKSDTVTTEILNTLNLFPTKCWAMQLKDLPNNGKAYKITFSTLENGGTFIKNIEKLEKQYKLEEGF